MDRFHDGLGDILVVAVPPTSGVVMPAPVTLSTARISRAEASVSPR
jgi:hypothetical protein